MSVSDAGKNRKPDVLPVVLFGSLTLLLMVYVLVVTLLADDSDNQAEAQKRNALIERIEPVGKSRTAIEAAAGAEGDGNSADTAADTSADASNSEAATEPAELTDQIKAAVDGICSGCHVAGVAGAPKIGDKAEWDKRAAAGLDALTQTVISGKGAMPPRGGSSLTDAEFPAAINYLMSK